MTDAIISYFKIEFESIADKVKAPQMKAYMKNRFEFVGVNSPTRKEIIKFCFQKFPIKTEEELFNLTYRLWEMPEREYQYAAQEALYKYRKLISVDSLFQFEYFITTKSWWDSVDDLSTNLIGEYFLRFPQKQNSQCEEWLNSNNIWLQRVCIIHQLHYKQDTNLELLTKAILHCKDSNEFFIQKGIGWALRQYARTDPNFVKDFVNSYTLKPLSKREAVKHL